MRKLAPLAPGDPIDVVAPSAPFERERFERGITALRSIGLKPRYADGVFERQGHLAGSDARRSEELAAALASDSKAIILARGGYGLLRIAPSSIKKLVIGYSDATVLHEVAHRSGTPSIHGPMCTQLGEDPQALERLDKLLKGAAANPIEFEKQPGARVEAPLRGGNLATLASLCGTPLQPQFENAIVLLEDLNEPPYRLDRLLTQLLQSHAFDGAKAFVIGDLTAPGEDPAGRIETVRERLTRLGRPLVFGAPFGHAGRNQPVALGVAHALDPEQGRLIPLDSPTALGQI